MAKMANFQVRNICEICGSEEKSFLLSIELLNPSVYNFIKTYYKNRLLLENLRGQKFEVCKCNKCGFIWQLNVFNKELMEDLYNKWIDSTSSLRKKREADISLYFRYALEMKIIAYLLKSNSYKVNLLDFGMGWGYWCLMGKAFGFNTYGIEISAERIDYARNLGINIIENMEKLKEKKFDFINIDNVLEHIKNPLDILKDLLSLLKKGGFIHIIIPDGRNIEKELKNPKWTASKNAIHPLEHINCFARSTLLKMCKLSGLIYAGCFSEFQEKLNYKEQIFFKILKKLKIPEKMIDKLYMKIYSIISRKSSNNLNIYLKKI